jgi:hypothetical protein
MAPVPSQRTNTFCTHAHHRDHSAVLKLLKLANYCVTLQKPQVAQLLRNFTTFDGTRRFITVVKRATH